MTNERLIDRGVGEDQTNPFADEERLQRSLDWDKGDPEFKHDLVSSAVRRLFERRKFDAALSSLKRAVADRKMTPADYDEILKDAMNEFLERNVEAMKFHGERASTVVNIGMIFGENQELLRIALEVYKGKVEGRIEYIQNQLAKLEEERAQASEAIDRIGV